MRILVFLIAALFAGCTSAAPSETSTLPSSAPPTAVASVAPSISQLPSALPSPSATPSVTPSPTVPSTPAPSATPTEMAPTSSPTASQELYSADSIINGSHSFVPSRDILDEYQLLTSAEQGYFPEYVNGATYDQELTGLNDCFDKSGGNERFDICSTKILQFFTIYVNTSDTAFYKLTQDTYNYTIGSKSGIFHNPDQLSFLNTQLRAVKPQ